MPQEDKKWLINFFSNCVIQSINFDSKSRRNYRYIYYNLCTYLLYKNKFARTKFQCKHMIMMKIYGQVKISIIRGSNCRHCFKQVPIVANTTRKATDATTTHLSTRKKLQLGSIRCAIVLWIT